MAIPGPRPARQLPAGRPMPEPDPALRAQIAELLARHDDCWRHLDFVAVVGLWDTDEPFPVYVGDEYRAPVIGWHDLGRHFGRLGGRLSEASMRSTLLEAHLVASDVAVATYLLDWTLATVESAGALSGQRWVTAMLRRSADAKWRFINCIESPAYGIDPARLDPEQEE